MVEIQWDIRRAGRAWRGDEARQRYNLTPEKFEMDEGKLFWTDEERVTLLALLLEKTAPSADDEAVRERAATAVAERALEHETNERVVWLDEL